MPPLRLARLTRLARLFQTGPLAGRLLLYVLLFSLVLSLVATSLQLLGDYRNGHARLVQLQQRTASLLAPTLAASLVNNDLAAVERQLEGLIHLPILQSVRVSSREGWVVERGVPGVGKERGSELGDGDQAGDGEGEGEGERAILEHTHALVAPPGALNTVGTLGLITSLEPLYQQLRDQALSSLLIHGLVVLLGALGLLLILRLTLTRHLQAMADFARDLDFQALIAPLQLKRRERGRPDELSELEKALNTMRSQLLEQTRHMRRAEIQSQGERDEAIRANQAKNLFLANVSHELRTPLQSVLGYAALLQDSELDPEQRDYVLTLKRSAENLSSIINDLLDISRMEAGKIALEVLPFDLRETLDDVVTMLGPRAREKNLALERRIDAHLPLAVMGDPIRCRQVMLNLVANAIKFTDSGHIMISTEVLERSAGGEVKLRLSVEDTGRGIASEDLPLIYEPYVQLHQRSQRKLSGVGLGLTISRQLVQLMGGKLEVESSPGKGSTFWVELGLPVAQEKSAQIRADARAIQGSRVLVADSYELSRKLSLDLLDSLGAQAEGVRSAAEVLQRLTEALDVERPFDALLVDGFLPDMDCDLLCQQVRGSPEHSETRILVLSSNPQRGDAEHFRQAGADAFLSKALRESLLAPLLQRLLVERTKLLVEPTKQARVFLTRFSLTSPPTPGHPAEPPCGEIHVLLVEDNPVNRALTERMLSKLGATVTAVNDGEAALALTRHEPFDLVLMDCNLPGIDGFETTRQMHGHERQQGLKQTPVVALTASAMEKDEEMCLRAGMVAFIAKPVTQAMLRAMLVQFCPLAQPQNLTTVVGDS